MVDVEVDYSDTTFATRADGTVLVWGDNNYGSAGVGNADYNVVGTPQVALGGGRADRPGRLRVERSRRSCGRPTTRTSSARRSTCRPRWRTRRSVRPPEGRRALTLSGPAPYDLVVTYRVGDGPQQTAPVAKGATSAALPVAVSDDTLDEADEQLPLQVLSISHSVPVDDGAAVVTVVDDDAAPSVSVGSVCGRRGVDVADRRDRAGDAVRAQRQGRRGVVVDGGRDGDRAGRRRRGARGRR